MDPKPIPKLGNLCEYYINVTSNFCMFYSNSKSMTDNYTILMNASPLASQSTSLLRMYSKPTIKMC